MTTKHSPLNVLRRQADEIAKQMKAAERGDIEVKDSARGKATVKFGIAMDDKILRIEIPWQTIKEFSEASLSAYILKHMRESRDTTH